MSTKINAKARAHESLGRRTYVAVSDRRRHDYDDGTLVRYASSRSTRSGGIPEYLGPDGVYVDPRDTAHFADVLHAFVTCPTERVSRGQALRTRAESMTWERNVAELMRLLAD